MKNNLKVERAIKNKTQTQLAELIRVSRQTINAMELNKYVPSTVLALKISRIFEKSVNELFFLDPEDCIVRSRRCYYKFETGIKPDLKRF